MYKKIRAKEFKDIFSKKVHFTLKCFHKKIIKCLFFKKIFIYTAFMQELKYFDGLTVQLNNYS